MSAKDAVLQKIGSHYVDDTGSSRAEAEGYSREEVFLYFAAKWRGKPIMVTMHADRYTASDWSEDMRTSTNRLGPWRVIAKDVRYIDPEKPGERGEHATGTARSALRQLCEPMVHDWLGGSEDYERSFKRALGQCVMRRFEETYYWSEHLTEALLRYGDRLDPAVLEPIATAQDARQAYEDAKARAFAAVEGEEAS